MEKAILTPSASTNIKTVEIIEEGNKHKCQIQAIKAFIQVSIFSGNALNTKEVYLYRKFKIRYMLLQLIVLTKFLKKLIY